MQFTKKMYLIDEHEYDRLSRPLSIKNELSWKRPIETRAKNFESRTMKSILNDETIPDDVKSKTYNQTLTRFINAKTKLDDNPSVLVEDEKEEVGPVRETIKPKKTSKKKKKPVVRYSPINLRKIRKRAFDHTIWSEY